MEKKDLFEARIACGNAEKLDDHAAAQRNQDEQSRQAVEDDALDQVTGGVIGMTQKKTGTDWLMF